jgi:sec-independent protein translocase protein TatB
MGGQNSKSTNSSINTNFCPLRVASVYVDLGESINKKKKIKAMVEYFMHDYYNYKLDVLCMQGIKSYKILKEVIREFKTYIAEYNDRHAKNGEDIYLEYFPDVEIKETKDEMNWSTSETEETDFYDKLVITRHEILSKATPALGVRDDPIHGYSYMNTYPSQEFLNRGENIMYNRDSDRIYDGRRHIQVVNINVNGTYISIYNVEFKSDVKGIRSSKERKAQIFDLKELVNQNAENSKDDRVREFEYGDDKYIAHNRNIHIVTGMFHINEMRNDDFNPEYIRTVKILEGLDTHRWVMAFRNRIRPESTNIKFSKDTYTLLISNPILDTADLQDKAKVLYQNYKTLVTSSIIMRNSVDMSYFTNYPIDTLFMIYKPKIGYAENGITRPDYFIRQEVYNRLTKTVNTRKSKRSNDADLDFRSIGKNRDDDDRIDIRTARRRAVQHDDDDDSSDKSRTRERINRLVSSEKDFKNRNEKKKTVKISDASSGRDKNNNKRTNRHSKSKGNAKKAGKTRSKTKTGRGGGKGDMKAKARPKKAKSDTVSSTDQNTVDAKKAHANKTHAKKAPAKKAPAKKAPAKKNTTPSPDDNVPVHPSAIDLLVDRYEPPEEDKDTNQNGNGNGDEIGDVELTEFDTKDDEWTTTTNDTSIIDEDSVSNKSDTDAKSPSSKDNDTRVSDKSTSPNNSSDSLRSRGSGDSNLIIHHGESLMNDRIDIDTDSEDDLANDEMMRIIDDN